MVKEKQLIKK